MLFLPQPVPPAIRDVIKENMGTETSRQYLAESAGGAVPKELALSLSHTAYFLRLDDLASGKGIAAAIPTSTRVLVSDGADHVYAIAEIQGEGKQARFMQLDKGPYVQPLVEEMQNFADRHEQSGLFQNLELRLLRIPGLYIVAIWLRNPGDRENLIIPIGRVPPSVEAGRVYQADDFLRSLRSDAQRRLRETQE